MPSVRTAVVGAAGGGGDGGGAPDPAAALAAAAPPSPDAIIDAVFGTGLSGPVAEPFASAISMINGRSCYAIAVDSPSGLDYSAGAAGGPDGQPRARVDATVTFHRARAGLSAHAASTGALHVEPIGIPPEAERGVPG